MPIRYFGKRAGDLLGHMAEQQAGGSRRDIERRLIEKSFRDEAFRQQLLREPKSTVEQELGGSCPKALRCGWFRRLPRPFTWCSPAPPRGCPRRAASSPMRIWRPWPEEEAAAAGPTAAKSPICVNQVIAAGDHPLQDCPIGEPLVRRLIPGPPPPQRTRPPSSSRRGDTVPGDEVSHPGRRARGRRAASRVSFERALDARPSWAIHETHLLVR